MSLRYQNGTWDCCTERKTALSWWDRITKRYWATFRQKSPKDDGIKHHITCRSIPDQAGIVKHDARYSSLVKKTTFTQKWVKPLPKIGEQFHACVSCQQSYGGRETLPHVTGWNYRRFRRRKRLLDKKVQKYRRQTAKKGNKKAPTTRNRGWSFFDLFCLRTVTGTAISRFIFLASIVYYNFKLTSTNCWYL